MIFYVATDDTGARHIKGTQAEAKDIDKDFVQIDVPTDKAGLQAAFQELFNDVDKLTTVNIELAKMASEKVPPQATSYTQQSMEIDTIWTNLPLTRKLHFAASAMEDARDLVAVVAKSS